MNTFTKIKRTLFWNPIRKLGFDKIIKPNDPFEIQKRFVSSDSPIIFDVGAHIGEIADVYLSYFSEPKIFCFEPFPDAFKELQEKYKSKTKIICENLAITNQIGKAQLSSNIFPRTNSLLNTDDHGSQKFWGDGIYETISKIEVNTETLDNYIDRNNILYIDILKIDVQGGEYKVLEGVVNSLNSKMIAVVYVEIMITPTYQNQNTIGEYFNFFESFGYTFLDFYHPVRKNDNLLQIDAIFYLKK